MTLETFIYISKLEISKLFTENRRGIIPQRKTFKGKLAEEKCTTLK